MSISDNLSGEPKDPDEPAHDDDWDEDEDTVKVHYDLSTWRLDQRSEATEAFAGAGVPHRWDDDELIVPESSEAAADELFTRLRDSLATRPPEGVGSASASGGVAELLPSDTPATLLDRAETALGMAKSAGAGSIVSTTPH